MVQVDGEKIKADTYYRLEFDLIGGAILTGKDFYLFVDNPRGNRQIRKGPL